AGTGCKGDKAEGGEAGGDDKKAFDAAAADLKQPVARIAAYESHIGLPDTSGKYVWKRGGDVGKAAMFAANEVRQAANEARQKLQKTSAAATKDLESALQTVSADCTDAGEPEPIAKCKASVKTLDAALAKAATAASAAGATGKIPRVNAESITPEATAAMATF